jgi:hypothetical protein
MRYPLIYVLLCALLLATSAPVRATYKWVDENGQTVYSQTPPPAGTQGAERIKAPPRPSTDPGSAAQKTKDDAAAFNERREEKKTAGQDQKKMQQAEAERKQQCEQMRQDVEILTTRPVVRRTPEDGGEPVVLTAEEREADVKEMRERLKQHCQ